MKSFLHAGNEDSAQADLSIRWAHMPEGTFSVVAVNFWGCG